MLSVAVLAVSDCPKQYTQLIAMMENNIIDFMKFFLLGFNEAP
jgi:hypothetical protein